MPKDIVVLGSVLVPFLTLVGAGLLLWATRAKPRRCADGTIEAASTFRARRFILVFEGIGGLLFASYLFLDVFRLLPSSLGALLGELLGYVAFAYVALPILIILAFPGVVANRR